ncbi:hypothetical protein SPB21_13765 [Leptothoe sp. ISB3NOV94-8A]
MSLIISMSVFGIATYIANTAKEEMIGVFAAILALLSLLLSIVLAPWFIQVIILLSVLSWQFSLRDRSNYSEN